MKIKLLWITDPWDTLDHEGDTTLRLAREAALQGAQSYWADSRTLRLEKNRVRLLTTPVFRAIRASRAGDLTDHSPHEFTQIHYRVDPPVNPSYIQPLQLLRFEVAQSKTTRILNPPGVLLSTNEKLEGAAFGNLFPKSLIASQWSTLKTFGTNLGKTVLKPLHSAQSKGVELLDWSSPSELERTRALVVAATENHTLPVMLQEYLPGIEAGEIRLWYVDGKLLAYARKLPLTGDFRVNIDRGSRVVPTALNRKEKAAAERVCAILIKRKIRLAAVDLIDAKVTDFNFTSPGLIPKMEMALQVNLAKPIVSALLKKPYWS